MISEQGSLRVVDWGELVLDDDDMTSVDGWVFAADVCMLVLLSEVRMVVLDVLASVLESSSPPLMLNNVEVVVERCREVKIAEGRNLVELGVGGRSRVSMGIHQQRLMRQILTNKLGAIPRPEESRRSDREEGDRPTMRIS